MKCINRVIKPKGNTMEIKVLFRRKINMAPLGLVASIATITSNFKIKLEKKRRMC